MRELECEANGLQSSVLGKITRSPKLLKRGDYILIAPQATKSKHGYAATIALSTETETVGTAAPQLKPESTVVTTAATSATTTVTADTANTVTSKTITAPTPDSSTATVATAQTAKANTPLLRCTAAALEQLADGDVVQIEPNGKLTVFLESTSKSNYLALTERCNHRCIMCPQPPVAKEESRLAFNLRLIDLMDRNTQEVGITGGEPTVVEDELITVLQTLKKKMPHAAVTILTNAVKLSDLNFTRRIALCDLSDLQVDVPLFGATAAKHNHIVGAKTFYRTIKGIYNLAQCGIDVGIRIVIHQLTYQHLTDMAYFIYHNFPFVKQVAFMQMETVGYARNNIDKLWIDPYDYKDELSEAVNYLRIRKIDAVIYNAQLCVLNPDVWDVAKQSISDWKNINLPECQQCAQRCNCAGFFASHKDYHSAHIKALPCPKQDKKPQ